jgi:hypothetical protein
METIDDDNCFSQQQHEEFARRMKGRGRGKGSHAATPCIGLAKATTMLIGEVMSPITVPSADSLEQLDHCTRGKAIGIMLKYLHSSNANAKKMLISSLWSTHVHKCVL